jgi:hypothetical protein
MWPVWDDAQGSGNFPDGLCLLPHIVPKVKSYDSIGEDKRGSALVLP